MEDFYKNDQKPKCFYIAPNCGLELELYFDKYNRDFGVEYQVLNIHDFPNVKDPRKTRGGWLSPMRDVTLPPDVKVEAGIPVQAKRFAYVYPPRDLADEINWENVSSPTTDDISHISDDNKTNKWALPYVASFGAYAYFDENLNLLAVNALSLEKTPYELDFDGPFVATKNSFREINDLNRYQSLYLDSFGELGFIGSAWMDPGENTFIDTEEEGQSNVQNHHGGFLYFRHDKSALIFLVDVDKSLTTPSRGVGSPIIDAFRLCKHELRTASLSTTCPSVEQSKMEIHRACQDGSKKHVLRFLNKNLLSQKSSSILMAQDPFGWTPIHYACCYHPDDDELIEMLLGACPEATLVKTINDIYPIHLACQGNPSLKTIELLIENDKKHLTIHAKSKHYEFLPLHFACGNNKASIEVIRTLILADLKDGATVNEKAKFGPTPLYMAIASSRSYEVIELLLRYGSNSSIFERVNGMLPIHLACLKGCSADILSLLLEADIEDKCFYSIVKECTEYGLVNSAILHIALAHSPIDVIKLLLVKEVKARCKPSKKVTNLLSIAEGLGGMFPIHVGCLRNDIGIEIIKTLLRLERVSISYTDGAGNTPLHHICSNKDADEEIVQLLLDAEDDYVGHEGKSFRLQKSAVMTHNKKNETPLHIAVKSRATGAHALLLPERICLKGMGGGGKDQLVNLVVASKKVDGVMVPMNKEVQNNLVANLAERQYFALIMLELYANIAAIVIYFNASINVVNGVRAIHHIESMALITCTTIFISRELIQLKSSTFSDYFSDGWNWIECSCNAVLLAATIHMMNLRDSTDLTPNRTLFMWSGILLLLQFVFIVRTTFLPFARFVAGLLAITFSLFPFLVVSMMLLLTFTYSYFVSGHRAEECPDFGSCLLWTLEGFFYGMDGFSVTPVLDVLFGLVAVVILLNVVIAIVSNAWDDSVDDTREVFWKSRVEVLFQYRVFKNVIGTDSFFLGPLFKQIDKVGICSISGKMSFWKLLISVTINVFWFVLGLFTFGLLWPKKLRYRILHAGM